ncbi:MAG: hypothetical protein P0Y65_04985 [Candidatus Devosia phytovorans]|uniref:Uncharacterized protein n=1 Tax=Candidatus Devosia phytovorans TaxID=3121372 RepID=A0AAJ5VY61_9HYPH|nr:hypothetical protein [Devosia sp.]WEK05614.1 MAG: hypothetical protein P0Y65_04985 [Devosia sp.]
MAFETNVFINCPFDEDYRPLLRPLLFCLLDLGFEPRIALETLNSAEPRILKILRLVEECKFGIHDLSRLRAKEAGEFYRMNMPFELGLDVGCRAYKGGVCADKRCLILEAERFRFQAAISDLSNSDIAVHGNQPTDILAEVRNWLNSQANLNAPGPTRIWGRFLDFMVTDYDDLKARGFSDHDIGKLPIDELMVRMKAWLSHN